MSAFPSARPEATAGTAGRSLARPPRDLRLDVVRGWMQLSIFISHVAGSAFAWAIHASWGLSDSSEQFVLLSGLTLGSVFTLKAARDGAAMARADLRSRTLRLYGTHLLVFAGFAAMVFALGLVPALRGDVMGFGWCWLAEAPWLALPAAATMLYQPEFMGILPVFVWCMLLLPGFLALAGRCGAWALLPSLAAWGAVQLGWVALPGLGGRDLEFDPLAWQLIFLIGAYAGRLALLRGGLPRHRGLTLAAAAVVALGLLARLVEHGLLPGPALAAAALQHKEVLAPARLLHALALAWLVAALVPREAGWMRLAPLQWLAAIGRHSLGVFCVGLFLAHGATVALRLWPAQAGWLDPVLIGTGIAVLGGVALRAERRRAPPPPWRTVAAMG
ncbi:OpgC domain-containing protein [Siccirubricoccus phaeus]|uniref:OpgC domain-containing protein n=1 Tax=Siccirubricoccus phaeus TaxID=2595053 RepID=UPI0011F15767|nr:OpgC domain-containing protein [Siccirubricoccus phaeus]